MCTVTHTETHISRRSLLSAVIGFHKHTHARTQSHLRGFIWLFSIFGHVWTPSFIQVTPHRPLEEETRCLWKCKCLLSGMSVNMQNTQEWVFIFHWLSRCLHQLLLPSMGGVCVCVCVFHWITHLGWKQIIKNWPNSPLWIYFSLHVFSQNCHNYCTKHAYTFVSLIDLSIICMFNLMAWRWVGWLWLIFFFWS